MRGLLWSFIGVCLPFAGISLFLDLSNAVDILVVGFAVSAANLIGWFEGKVEEK